MPTATLTDQLIKYLTDAHAIETQALAQLRTAPDIAGEPQLARLFDQHLAETERHEHLVRERLEAHGAGPSRLKEAVMAAGGKGFILFARSQPDTPGKLAAHAHSYEALEEASYELLTRVAERSGDDETAAVARTIRDEERAMKDRLAAAFDVAVAASLRDKAPDDLTAQLVKYLADAHAIEAQSIQLLERSPKLAGDPELARLYGEHLTETRTHQRLVEERLAAHDEGPSRLKDAAMPPGGLNWGMFFHAHPDTAGKLAPFAYAFEHLEIGGYEELSRVADRANDAETKTAAERILGEERSAAEKLAEAFDRAVDASFR